MYVMHVQNAFSFPVFTQKIEKWSLFIATELHVCLSDIKHNKLLQSPVSQHTGDALNNLAAEKFEICLRQLPML